MKVGISGLGLIGGSFAKAYKSAGHTVFGYDRDDSVQGFATLSGAVDGVLDEASVKTCDCIFIALYPQAAVEYLQRIAPFITPGTFVIDLCGVKRIVCSTCFDIAAKYGFTFVGGHPMAGTHNSGFKYSRASLLKGASMIIVPPIFDDMALYERIETLLEPAGFGKITITTSEKHDQMIAFTSQMAHIVSSAFIKSPTAKAHKGFTAGSYKDLTRVAWLNPNMWTELFLENSDNLIKELDFFIESLMKYRVSIAEGDAETLRGLLEEGKKRKEEISGR
ncbi:MAG: prephenate dehydrogenase [Oscillospiraceae bacterium]